MARILPVPDPTASTAPVPTPYERPFATPEGQGAGLGDVAEQAGRVVEGYARDATEKANTAAVLGAIGKGQAALNTFILDDRNGYASLRGSDAMAGREQAQKQFVK